MIVVCLLGAASLTLAGATIAEAATPVPGPAPRDSQSAGDAGTAKAIAHKFKHAVAVDSLTTATTQVTAASDGTLTLYATALPVRAKVGSKWVSVDLDLSLDSGYVVPKATAQPVQFSAGGGGPLARVKGADGKWVEEGSPFGSLPKPTLKGASATYADVLPGVDLRLTATSIGMAEVLIVKDAKAASNPALSRVRFGIEGGAVSQDGSGNAHAGEKSSKDVVASSPLWWDSSQGSDASGPAGTVMPQPVDQTVSSDSLTLSAGAAATAPDVTYPVYIDPDWSSGQNAFWYVDQAYPGQSYLNGAYATGVQREGYVSAANSPQDHRNHLARAFWNFNTTALVGSTIQAAHFNVALSGAFNCGQMRQSNLWTTSGAPIGGTWNQTGNVYSQVISSATPAGCGAAVGFDALVAAQQAAAGVTSTTLALRANNESDQYNWSKWYQGASLTVTYNGSPYPPSNLGYSTPSASCSTSATTPTAVDGMSQIVLTATSSDPDTNQNLATTFTLKDAASGKVLQTSSTAYQAQNATPQMTIPPNALQAGVYAWSAVANDGYATGPASATCYFVILNAGPGAPSVSPVPSGSVVGHPIGFTFGAPIVDGVKEFAYWFAYGPMATTPPQPPANPRLKPGDALPACGAEADGVHYVCLPAGQTSVSVQVAPVDDVSTLWVVAYNAAARVSSTSSGGYSATGKEIDADSDTTSIDPSHGHMWNTEGAASTYNSTWNYNEINVSDENTTNVNGGDFGDGFDLNWIDGKTKDDNISGPPETSELYAQHYTQLNQFITTDSTYISGNEADPANYTDVFPVTGLGGIAPLNDWVPEDSSELYSCTLSTHHEMTSLDANCEGHGASGAPLGYVWNEQNPDPAPWSVTLIELDRCKDLDTGDTFDRSGSGCNGDPYGIYANVVLDKVLGWVVQSGGSLNAHAAVDTSASFTASMWLNPQNIMAGQEYVAMAQESRGDGSFELMIGKDQHLKFCLHVPATPTETSCLEGPILKTYQWTMVTVVFDATNHETRLLLDGDIQPVASVSQATIPLAFDTPDGLFDIGESLSDGSGWGEWDGELADPAVFPGVIASDQLLNLHNFTNP